MNHLVWLGAVVSCAELLTCAQLDGWLVAFGLVIGP